MLFLLIICDFYMAITKDKVLDVLDGVVHPESGAGLAADGIVSRVDVSEERIDVGLKFRRARDPFAAALRRQAAGALSAAFPGVEVAVNVVEHPPVTAGGGAAKALEEAPDKRIAGVKKIVAIASGKGGVGKSTVAASLAETLARRGYRVGILDADIYGPSQPILFDVEGYLPPVLDEGGEMMVPAESRGVKIMSIGFFIPPDNALIWRGPMATGALRQLVRQTVWGELDFLLIDMPPGTGDIHLSVVHELSIDGAVIVSTPGRLALADVKRGVEMFRSEGIAVPVLGVVENMAWFTPAELPDNRYYIFGRGGARRFAEDEGVDFLGDIPLVQSAGEGTDGGLSASGIRDGVATYYSDIARKIVDKLSGWC